jgi:hypothetical protein
MVSEVTFISFSYVMLYALSFKHYIQYRYNKD